LRNEAHWFSKNFVLQFFGSQVVPQGTFQPGRDSGLAGKPGRHSSRYIARYILVAIYTGSRHGDICGAALMPPLATPRYWQTSGDRI
jgi:hypothetical protein